MADSMNNDGHCCTDDEVVLVVLLTLPRVSDEDFQLPPALPAELLPFQTTVHLIPQRQQQPIWHEDPGGLAERAIIRSTRLLV